MKRKFMGAALISAFLLVLLTANSVSAQMFTEAIYVDPQALDAYIGGKFSVDIKIANVPDPVFAVQIGLSWNSSAINVTVWQEGGFLKGLNGTTQPVFKANNTAGLLQFWNNRSDPQSGGVIGSGTLVSLAFLGKNLTYGGVPLHLYDVHLQDPSFQEITGFRLVDGLYAIIPQPIPEFPQFLVVPLFMAITLMTIIISRRKRVLDSRTQA